MLAQVLHALPISSGDLFRKAFEERTELGLKAKAFMDRGELVPDDITVGMVLQHIKDLHDKCRCHIIVDRDSAGHQEFEVCYSGCYQSFMEMPNERAEVFLGMVQPRLVFNTFIDAFLPTARRCRFHHLRQV
jgi:hypothetical protein